MRRFAIHGAIILAGLGSLGLAAAWLGLVPIAASSGHWAITTWLLHSTMRRSVELRSAGIEPPPLDDIAMIERGAGHFYTGCAPCHGAPGFPQSPVALEMTPHPPYLPPRIKSWDAEELYWIVLHGVKFTGMPAWPTQEREDEPWSVVAFLLRLPGMSPAEYRELALGPMADAERPGSKAAMRLASLTESVATELENCARCHGLDGMGRGTGAVPILAGLSPPYIVASLQAFARGARHSGIMQPQAKGLDNRAMQALARHYAGETPAGSRPGAKTPVQTQSARAAAPSEEAPRANAPEDGLAFGRRIAHEGVPEAGVPSCVPCHGPIDRPRHPLYPGLAGQRAGYLEAQLRLWQKGQRGGTPYAHIMATIAKHMTPEEIAAVARYYASLPLDGTR